MFEMSSETSVSEDIGSDPVAAVDQKRGMHRELVRIRLVEERIVELYPEQEMRCPTHLSIGQEAVAVGVCAHLRPEDQAISAHRSHAHYLAKGGDLRRMLAEIYGKVTGCARGKGGSMHLIDLQVGFLGCVPIVGSTIPIGVGAAFGARLRGEESPTAVFFGDGAAETGVFHESLNFACVHALPVFFVCENNLYSVNTPLAPRQPEDRSITDLARGHGMTCRQVDGQDADAVWSTAGALVDDLRRGNGPVFLEAMTYRWLEHCGPNNDVQFGLRPEDEYNTWLGRDPLSFYEQKLLEEGVIDEADAESVRTSVARDIDDAVEFAKSSPFPPREELMQHVYPESEHV
jgi:pyruvate dehydrogenase E1 component alpha subunit